MELEAPKRVKTGGRQKGSGNVLPDLRAMTLKALMKAGGIDYLVEQSSANPQAFLNLLGKVMPREATVELTGELRIRQEVRRDLVEKVIVLLRPTEQDAGNVLENASSAPLPAIAHKPDAMLKAQRNAPRESLSRSTENARAEGSAITSGILQRATAMHLERAPKPSERSEPQGYAEQALARIDGRSAQETEQGKRGGGKPSVSPRARTQDASGPTPPGVT